MLAHFDSLYSLFEAFPDEQSCLDHLCSIRWHDGAFCPYCVKNGKEPGQKIYHFSDRKTFKCGECRERFSIKVGTVFEDTKLPLRKWFAAIWMITNHPKGIASTTLAKDLKITQKSAWFALHRLRHAARTPSFNAPLKGTVEADTAFLSGVERATNTLTNALPAHRVALASPLCSGLLSAMASFAPHTSANKGKPQTRSERTLSANRC
jgi:hypothetical protein